MTEESRREGSPTPFVIAEAGVNHDGSLARALELVDVAAACGADAVKFQTFRADELATAAARKAAYQEETTGPGGGQLEMLRALELGPEEHRALVERCGARGIEFLSTPFDLGSLALLLELGVGRIKIASGDLTFGPLLHRAGRSGLPVILSTGMGTLDEVAEALGALAHGMASDGEPRGRGDLAEALGSAEGRAALEERVTLLHCVSRYPTPPEDVHLLAMGVLEERFGLPVGFSDHTEGTEVPIAAAALGATVIEKHFTLDRSLPGPDHRASLEPDELARMVRGARIAAAARGEARKAPGAGELGTRALVRRGIVAARDLGAGEVPGPADLACRRPERGPSPMDWWGTVGRAVPAAVAAGEPLLAPDAAEVRP